jgi:hypothetical protein
METPDSDQGPPIFGSWTGWYIFIMLVLVIQIVGYLWLTNKYL